MRMRRKKHLEEKLALCKNLIDFPAVTRDFRIEISEKEYIDFSSIFNNENLIHMEIGCGKGQFIAELAKRNPDINYIAVDSDKNVICTSCLKLQDAGIKNVIFLHCRAETLPKYIKSGSIGRLFLNFSSPYPKKTNENKRLTNARFLDMYSELLARGAEIHQKTDNMKFFEYSLEQYSLKGFKLKNISLDLHASDFEGNIITEYESRFISMGKPIYRLEAYK